MIKITVQVTEFDLQKIKDLVEEGEYPSIAEYVRQAIRHYRHVKWVPISQQ